MECVFSQWKHSTPGFPGVILKWSEGPLFVEKTSMKDGVFDAYVTVNGEITRGWNFEDQTRTMACKRPAECERFDAWVRRVYAEIPAVQG